MCMYLMVQGADSIYGCLTSIGIPIINIRQSHNYHFYHGNTCTDKTMSLYRISSHDGWKIGRYILINWFMSNPVPNDDMGCSSLCRWVYKVVIKSVDAQRQVWFNRVYKQWVLMHRHQGWNVQHGLCHIYMRYLYIYELFIAFVCFVVCSLL